MPAASLVTAALIFASLDGLEGTIDELLAYAAAENHAPYFAPGEGHHYSNTDYLLLGLIVSFVLAKTL